MTEDGREATTSPEEIIAYYEDMIQRARRLGHDLNQPLQAISGYTDLLVYGMSQTDPNYSKILKIQDAARRVNQMVAEMMQRVLIKHPSGDRS